MSTGKQIILWILIIGTVFLGVNMMSEKKVPKDLNLTYSQFFEAVNTEQISEVCLRDLTICEGKLKNGKTFATYVPYDMELIHNLLRQKDVSVISIPVQHELSLWKSMLPWIVFLLPIILLGMFFSRSIRQTSRFKRTLKSDEKSRSKKPVTFDDVAGVNDAKIELQEVVEFLKAPKKFQKLGGRIPKGVLLVGPPGTGKTLLAKAIAGEAGVPFYSMAGSDFVEVFVGVGASRVRELFGQAKKDSPSIIFIDEIDAVGRRRGALASGGNSEREQTLNQILVEMDGFDDSQTVIVIAATNRPDVLDSALLRPGRFDRIVSVPNPDLMGREQILKVHCKDVPLNDDVDLKVLACGTPGFSGADLANVINEAALLSARRNLKKVGMAEFEEAKDKVMMGTERRSLVMTDEARRLTAFHESGHALVSFYTPGTSSLHKATIVPRGEALGMVVHLPKDDQVSTTYQSLIADIMVKTGGRIAEEMIFGEEFITTGASADIKAATEQARRMVTEWGMSHRIGFRTCDGNERYEQRFSEMTAQTIDEEVHRILMECFDKTKDLLKEHEKQLNDLANALLERETLTGEQIKMILEGQSLPPIKSALLEKKAKKKTGKSRSKKTVENNAKNIESEPGASEEEK